MADNTNNTSDRGFASMDDDKQRDIASKGGQASSGSFEEGSERASEAGRKGGEASSGSFDEDRERASEAGRKGGEASDGGNR